jgi:group I intron endonuclease
MNDCGVYKIFNVVNGDFYIGSSAYLRKRFIRHRWELNKNHHVNAHLQNAWNKYGEQAFEFKIVLLCDTENQLYYEQVLLDGLKPTYNISPKAGSCLGVKHSEETRRNMSKAHIGIVQTEESKRKKSEALKGKPNGKLGTHASDETKRKMSESHQYVSDESKRKMSESHMGKPGTMLGKHHSEEARAKISEAHKGNTYCFGHKHTEESKHKISVAGMGRLKSEETCQRLSDSHTGELNPMFGRQHSEETKQRMREVKTGEQNGFFGRQHSEEAKRLIGSKSRGRVFSEETRKKMSEDQKQRQQAIRQLGAK